VGRFHVYCVLTRRGVISNHQEEWHRHVPTRRRTITVAGMFAGSEADDWTASVVGGTGAYEGARGTLISVAGQNASRTDTPRLLP
jgi:hypothetical protein